MSDPSAYINALLVAYKHEFDHDQAASKPVDDFCPPFVTTLVGVLYWTAFDRGQPKALSRTYVDKLKSKNRLGLLEEFLTRAHCEQDPYGFQAPVLRYVLFQHILTTNTQECLSLLLDLLHGECLFEREICWLSTLITRKYREITQENWAKVKNLRYKLRKTAAKRLTKALISLHQHFKDFEKIPSDLVRLVIVKEDEDGRGIRVHFTSDTSLQSDTLHSRV